MTVFSMIVVYVMVFWTVLFAVLPWGNRAHEEHGQGLAGSAPQTPRIRQKFAVTAIISTRLWAIICAMIYYNVFDLFEMGRLMAVEDYGS